MKTPWRRLFQKYSLFSILFFCFFCSGPFEGQGYFNQFPPFPKWRPAPYPSPKFVNIPMEEGIHRYGGFEIKVRVKSAKLTLIQALEKLRKSGSEGSEKGEPKDKKKPKLLFNGKIPEYPNFVISYAGKEIVRFNEDRAFPQPNPVSIADLDDNGYPDIVISGERYVISEAEEENEKGTKKNNEMLNGDDVPDADEEQAKMRDERQDEVLVFLQTAPGMFSKIEYKTYFYDPRDFIDVNGGGKFEVLTTNVTRTRCIDGASRTFIVYNLYALEGANFVTSNHLVPGFPKFEWYAKKQTLTESELVTLWDKNRYASTLPQMIRGTFVNTAQEKESA